MKVTTILWISLMAGAGSLAQTQDKVKDKEVQRTAAEKRSRSSVSSQRTANELKDDRGQVSQTNSEDMLNGDNNASDSTETNNLAKSSGAKPGEKSEVITPNENQPHDTEGRKSNAPAVIQRTTSESGSPAILSQENGAGKDGTNTVQRSKPNMAGAEVPGNMRLSKKNSAERNINTGQDIRKQEEQPQQEISKAEQEANKKTVNAQQNKDEGDKEDRKSKRKKRRSKDKDSAL